VEGRDYDLEKTPALLLLTAEQDWAICGNQQRGVNSHAYHSRPLSLQGIQPGIVPLLVFAEFENCVGKMKKTFAPVYIGFGMLHSSLHHGGRATARAQYWRACQKKLANLSLTTRHMPAWLRQWRSLRQMIGTLLG